MVANGDKVPGVGICSKLALELPGVVVQEPYYVLRLGGVDAVQGSSWLRELGPNTWDFKLMTMNFKTQGRIVHL